jgi:hypothetical protein
LIHINADGVTFGKLAITSTVPRHAQRGAAFLEHDRRDHGK